jgi:hypothetical protein
VTDGKTKSRGAFSGLMPGGKTGGYAADGELDRTYLLAGSMNQRSQVALELFGRFFVCGPLRGAEQGTEGRHNLGIDL